MTIMKDYLDNIKKWKRRNFEFSEILPEVSKKFAGLTQSVYKDGSLSKKTKLLIAIASSLASKCEHCATNHIITAKKIGVTKEELAEMISVLVTVIGGSGWQQDNVFEVFDKTEI